MADINKLYLIQTARFDEPETNLSYQKCKLEPLPQNKAYKCVPLDSNYTVKRFNQEYFDFLLYTKKIFEVQDNEQE